MSAARESTHRKEKVQGTVGKAHNSMCGDIVELGFSGGKHLDLHHAGEGCILSQAFASIACSEFRGLEESAIKEKTKQLADYLAAGKAAELPEALNATGFAAAAGLLEFSTRHPCIMLFSKSFEDAWSKKSEERSSDSDSASIKDSSYTRSKEWKPSPEEKLCPPVDPISEAK